MGCGNKCNGQHNCNHINCGSQICRPQGGPMTNNYCRPQGLPINPRPRTSWTTTMVGYKFRKQYIDELRTALNAEFLVRKKSKPVDYTNIEIGNKQRQIFYKELISLIDNVYISDSGNAFKWNLNYNIGEKNSLQVLISLRNNINILQDKCICQCDYCSCQCDYCTCQCNYCSCQCNYCSCVCAYGCTCHCNY